VLLREMIIFIQKVTLQRDLMELGPLEKEQILSEGMIISDLKEILKKDLMAAGHLGKEQML